jgi:hypothetical protein
MAKMSAAKRRELELEDYQAPTLPQKTVQPVKAPGLLAPAPAAVPAVAPVAADPRNLKGVSLADIAKLNVLGGSVLNPLFQSKGFTGVGDGTGRNWQTEGGALESGETQYLATPNADALKAFDGYTFDWTQGDRAEGTLVGRDSTGQQVGSWYQAPRESALKGMLEAAALAAAGFGGVGLMGLGPLGGALGGLGGAGAAAEGAAASGAAANTAGGLIGAGEGAAQLAAYTAANPLTAAQVTASMLPAGGLPGLGAVGGGLLASVPAEALASLEAFSAANPLTAAQVTASTLPAGGLPGLSGSLLGGLPAITADPAAAIEAYTAANPVTMPQIAATIPEAGFPGLSSGVTSGAMESLNAYSAANPVTMPEIAATMPEISMPAMSSAAPAFNAAADSQLASSQLGITGAQSAAAATAPATVNLGSLGGTMGTAGGLQGAFDVAKQAASDLMTTPNAVTGQGGGLLGSAASWMKDNPTLGRLLLSGASGLLSGSGGGSSGAPHTPAGPPVQWNSNLQQGLLSPVQQYAPPPVVQNRPAGLLAQGFQNDGAWRYLKG